MRRYWMISLAIGGGVAVLVMALMLGGAFDRAAVWLGGVYQARGWAPAGELLRLRWPEFLLVAFASTGVASGVVESTRIWQKALVAGGGALGAAMVSPTLALYGVLVDPFSLLASTVLAAGGAALFARTEWGRRKGLLEDALGTRVSAGVFADLLEAPEPPGFAGTSREVTTLVCRWNRSVDPVGRAESPDLLKMASLFRRAVETFLLSRGAYLEESVPEKVVATFGMLRDSGDHAERACRAAIDLKSRLRGLSQEFESRWFRPLRWGIGLGSGTMTVGLCGVPGRFSFSGLGGEADFADRLALANERLGSDVLLGPGCYRLIRERFEVRPLEMVYDPVGMGLLEVYQLLAAKESFSEEDGARRDWFWQGVIRLREGDPAAALECFGRAKSPGFEDLPLSLLVSRAQDSVVQPESRSSRLLREFTDGGRTRLIERL